MKKVIRLIVRLVVLLAAIVIVGAVAVNLFADNAVRIAVEEASTKALEVPVDVEQAKLSIFGGTLFLKDLKVANPPGYQQESILHLDRGDIRVNARSLLSETIKIESIKLDGMKVAIEQKGLDNNLREVIESLRRDRDPSGKKVQVDNLEITDITVTVKLLPIPGQADTLSFKVAPIKMTDLGRNQPMDIATLATTVLLAVAQSISEQGDDVLPKDMLTDLSSVLNKALDIGRIIFGNGQDAKNGTSSLSRGITEGLKGLLKTQEDTEQP
jgi:uncharacterized protein involved in outer membrane biogenesis